MAGRYKAEVLSGDEYLLKLSRYIHQNPVAVRTWRNRSLEERIDRLGTYRWSSYRGYVGEEKPAAFVHTAPVLALVDIHGKGGPRGYRQYVESGLAPTGSRHMRLRATCIALTVTRGFEQAPFRVGRYCRPDEILILSRHGRLEKSVLAG